MQNDTLVWLQEWFRKQSPDVESDLTVLREIDYFAAGYVDSLGIVNLIVDAEKQFDVAFSMEGYEDPRFSTVGGLAEIIESLRAER